MMQPPRTPALPGHRISHRAIEVLSAWLCRVVIRERKRRPDLFAALLRENLLDEAALRGLTELYQGAMDATEQAALRRQLFIDQPNELFKALSEQVYQRQRLDYRGESRKVIFSREALSQSLRASHSGSRADLLIKAAAALSLLVPAENTDQLRFLYRPLQEFFAALKLVHTREVTLAAAPEREEQFRQPLAAARRAITAEQPLPGPDPSGWEETLAMAACWGNAEPLITALATVNPPLASHCAHLAGVPLPLREQLAETLKMRMRDSRLDLRARIATGKALGESGQLQVLGFTPLHAADGTLRAWLPPLATIPAGTWAVGSQDDPEADETEPRFTVTLEAFELSYFQLTVAEWRCFMAAGGYDNPAWWPGKAAADFRQGGAQQGDINMWEHLRRAFEAGELEALLQKSSMNLELREQVRQTVTRDAAGWEAHLDGLRRQSGPVTEPAGWRDGRYNNPLQPVAGISLYETLAYCHWLTELTGRRYTLPNELQWEVAARGQASRHYAWGDQFEPDHVNCRDQDGRFLVGAPTPVGLYAQGKTPDHGLYEMTGNVGERTSSAAREAPPYDTGLLTQIDDGKQPLIIRGGSWQGFRHLARAACRGLGFPDVRGPSLGCRLCHYPDAQ